MSITIVPWKTIQLGTVKDPDVFRKLLKSEGIEIGLNALDILSKLVSQSAKDGMPNLITLATPRELGLSCFCSFEGICKVAETRGFNTEKSLVHSDGQIYLLELNQSGNCQCLNARLYEPPNEFFGLSHRFVFVPYKKN